MSLSIHFPFLGGCWTKRRPGLMLIPGISLAFLHWVRIILHLWPFVSDIAIFVLKRDVKLQLTNSVFCCCSYVSNYSEFFSCTCSGSKPPGISGTGCLWSRCPSCRPTNSIKALKETQNIDSNLGKLLPGLILSLSTATLLGEVMLLCMCRV